MPVLCLQETSIRETCLSLSVLFHKKETLPSDQLPIGVLSSFASSPSILTVYLEWKVMTSKIYFQFNMSKSVVVCLCTIGCNSGCQIEAINSQKCNTLLTACSC